MSEQQIPVVHSRSMGRRIAVQSGNDPICPLAYITATDLAELRRKAAAYDAGAPGWIARIDGELVMTTLADNPGDLAAGLNGPHEIVAVRIVEVPQ